MSKHFKQRRLLQLKQYQEDTIKITIESGLEIPTYSVLNELLEWKSFDEKLSFDFEYVEAIRYSVEKVRILLKFAF